MHMGVSKTDNVLGTKSVVITMFNWYYPYSRVILAHGYRQVTWISCFHIPRPYLGLGIEYNAFNQVLVWISGYPKLSKSDYAGDKD